MNSILQYQDYRRFLQDYYDWKKRRSVFSWRDFSRMAGFTSPVFLKQVCEGKANLGKKATVKVADAFGFVGIERDYFFQHGPVRPGQDRREAALRLCRDGEHRERKQGGACRHRCLQVL